MGCKIFGPRCFLATAYFIMSILSVFGIAGGIISYLQSKSIHNIGDWPFNVRPLICSHIAIRSLFPAAGVFAVIAACRKQPRYLYVSGFILLAIFTCSAVFGLVAYQVTQQQISGGMSVAFRRGMNSSSPEMFNWMNDIQWQYKCCGVSSYADWYTVDTKIPASCCKPESLTDKKECPMYISRSNLTKAELHKSVLYTQGCESFVTTAKSMLILRIGHDLLLCAFLSLPVAAYLYIGVTLYFLPEQNQDGTNCAANATNGSENCGNGTGNGPQNDFQDAATKRLMRRKQRRMENLNNNDSNYFGGSNTRFPKSQGQGSNKFVRPGNRLRGNGSNSKSLIMGDGPSKLLTPIDEENDSEIVTKNVDMLWYQSLEKNFSTLSTTPFSYDISSLALPGTAQLTKPPSLGMEGVNLDEESIALRNAVYTIVSERPLSPTLSQNCSSFVVPTNNNVQNDQSAINKETDEPLMPIEADLENCEDSTTAQANQLASPNPPNKFLNPTASVRSSTLATIHEESESSKGSPNQTKGTTPTASTTATATNANNILNTSNPGSKSKLQQINVAVDEEEILNNNGVSKQYNQVVDESAKV